MPTDTDVRELLDRARIADVIHAYSDHADRADVDALVDLFTPDGEIDLGGGAVHRGHAELRDMFHDRFQLYTGTSFFTTGVRLVRYDGVTAETSTHLQTFHTARGRQMHLRGVFEDDLVQQSGTWRFTRRRLLVAGVNHLDVEDVPARFSRVRRSPVPQQ